MQQSHRRGRLVTRIAVTAALVAGGIAVVAVGPVVANACNPVGYTVGNGSEETPFQIDSAAHLLSLSATPADWGKHFKQTAELDLVGCEWTPIGNGVTQFRGVYDGGGFEIRNLTVDSNLTTGVALFGQAVDAQFRNIHLHNVSVTQSASNSDTGALVGRMTGGSIDSVSITGTLSIVGAANSGALVGSNGTGPIQNVTISATGTVMGSTHVAGLVGYNGFADTPPFPKGGPISYVSVTGALAISSDNNNVGGVAGTSSGDIANASVGPGVSVTTTQDNAGGLVGAANGGSIVSSRSAASVTASDSAGGLVGVNSATIQGSFATGDVTASASSQYSGVGGFVGDSSGAAISDSYATGTVTGKASVGGFVGYLYDGSLTNVHATGAVNGEDGVGGLVGLMYDGGVLTTVSATGRVTGQDNVGGLVGNLDIDWGSSHIVDSFSTSRVSGRAGVGGLIGALFASRASFTSTITRSYASGAVEGTDDVGGLIGTNTVRSFIVDSYARGMVTGGDAVGGLIGHDKGGSLERTYSSGAVTGTADVGGLVGKAAVDTAVSVSFWDRQTSQRETSAGGGGAVGLTTAEMKQLSTFTTQLDENDRWDMVGSISGSSIWGVCAFANDGYPFLMWQGLLASGSPGALTCTPPPPPPPPAPVVPALPASTGESTPTTVPSTTVPSTSTTLPSTVTPAPTTLEDGALPQLQPGASQVLLNGEPVEVEVLIENDTSLVMRGQDFELRLQPECEAVCNIVTTADGRQALLLEQEGLAEVGGFGFQADSPVYVWLFSEPRFLGELTVNPDGTFSGLVPLGDVEPGEHTLQVNGTSFDGLPRSANLGVIVNQSPGGGTSPEGALLPATGGMASTLVWALMAVALGVGTLGVRRRWVGVKA